MPWIKYKEDDEPDHYEFPKVMTDDTVLNCANTYAKSKRKEIGQIREGLVATQKAIGRDDRENARWLSNLAAEYMKQFRAWDFLIRWMEGEPALILWRRPCIQEEIAPYLDAVCNEMTFGVDASPTLC